jgi:hypothetical protein
MITEKQRRIEQRAYALWEAEGQPQGRHEEHWHRAAREVEAEDSDAITVSRKRQTSRRVASEPRSPSPQRRKKVSS